MRRIAAAFAALLAFASIATAPGMALAQSGESRGGQPGAFDFYVLALSWSPGYCALEGERKGRDQCVPGKSLGFVVHGLWPQNETGFPTECAPAGRTPSRIALDGAKGVYPDEGLARYQWRRHGVCSGKSPSDYFAEVRRAREIVILPPAFEKAGAEQRWTPIDLERAFVAANPGLRTDMMSTTCRRGALQEVRICFTKDLRSFRRCEEIDRRGCRGGEIKVEAGR